MAYVFFTSKSFDVIISRSWLVLLSLIGLIGTSKILCFGSPPTIRGSVTTGVSIQWSTAACEYNGLTVIVLLIFTVTFLIVILLKFLRDNFNARRGHELLTEILRRGIRP